MEVNSQASVLKRTYFGLNLLSFCFNWDNYALLPVLYPRITSPHFANDSAVTFGWVGASFAIAAMLGSLLFGGWADRRGAREPLFVAQFVMMIGDIFTYLRLNASWNLLVGRAISGIGSGSRTCCLWYLAKTTTGEERGKMIGNWYAAGMLGMVLAPAVSAITGTLPTPETGGPLSINAYNAPALSSLLLHIVAVYIVHRWVHDVPPKDDSLYTPIGAMRGTEEEEALVDSAAREAPPDSMQYGDARDNIGPPYGCYILVACQFLMVTGISSFETIIVPLFGSRFGSPAWVNGLVFAGIGLVVLISAIVSGVLNEGLKWSERKVEIIGLALFAIGCVLSFDYPSTSHGLMVFLEVLSTVLVSAGFTMAFCMQPSLFSKLIINHQGGKLIPNMGHYMSWLSVAGSMAKISGPLIIGYGLTSVSSINTLVSVIIGVAGVTGLLFALGWAGLIVPDDGTNMDEAALSEEHKYLAPQKQIVHEDGTLDLRRSFVDASRSMSMGEAALARAIGD